MFSRACQKDYEALHRPADKSFGRFVSKELAVKIGDELRFSSRDKASNASEMRKRKAVNKKLKEVRTLKDKNGKTDLYILNYQHGGFVLLTVDKRMPPILAYSDQNTSPTDSKSCPGGLSSWLNTAEEQLKTSERETTDKALNEKCAWDTQKPLTRPLAMPPTDWWNSSVLLWLPLGIIEISHLVIVYLCVV